MSISIDGFVAGTKAGSDWNLRGGSPDSAAWVREIIAGAGIHAVGRNLFESWASFWPTSDSPMAAPVNDIPKIVFTHQRDYVPSGLSDAGKKSPSAESWTNPRVASGRLEEEIAALKAEDGAYILAQGGVEFARSLVAAGLIDEYRFAVLPVALGQGENIFSRLPDELDL
jgi:dihydrofolate reductase